jgi:outer membrane murein-binding lipoprotein Lpp
MASLKTEFMAETRKLKSKVKTLEAKVKRLEGKLRRVANRKKIRTHSRTAKVSAFQNIGRNARILATVQVQGEWTALVQLSNGDRRHVRVGSILGDLTVKDLTARRLVLSASNGQEIVLTISGV